MEKERLIEKSGKIRRFPQKRAVSLSEGTGLKVFDSRHRIEVKLIFVLKGSKNTKNHDKRIVSLHH